MSEALAEELRQATGKRVQPLDPVEVAEGLLCYIDDCPELAAVWVFLFITENEEAPVQKCEGHARLHYDSEYQRLRAKWRKQGWGV